MKSYSQQDSYLTNIEVGVDNNKLPNFSFKEPTILPLENPIDRSTLTVFRSIVEAREALGEGQPFLLAENNLLAIISPGSSLILFS